MHWTAKHPVFHKDWVKHQILTLGASHYLVDSRGGSGTFLVDCLHTDAWLDHDLLGIVALKGQRENEEAPVPVYNLRNWQWMVEAAYWLGFLESQKTMNLYRPRGRGCAYIRTYRHAL